MRTLPLLLVLIACHGGFHCKGDRVWSAQVQYGEPIPGRSISGSVEGTAPTAGIGVFHHWYTHDRVAWGVGVTPTLYFDDAGTEFGAEFNGQFRWHFWETEHIGFFVDVQAGFLLATDDIPPGGTPWNFTYGFGPGFEVPFDDRISLVGGALFHHWSNGKGLGVDVDDNPSQNEIRVWLGLGWDW